MAHWGEAIPVTQAPPKASLFQSCGLIPHGQDLKARPLASPGRGQAIWLKQEKIHKEHLVSVSLPSELLWSETP